MDPVKPPSRLIRGLAAWRGALAGILLYGCASFSSLKVAQDPLTAKEHKTLGDSYLANGEKQLAAQQFQAAIKADPRDVPALIALGNMAYEEQAWKKAASYFRKALKALPNDASASNNLAMVYVAQGRRLDRAKRLIAQALPMAGPITPYLLDTSAQISLQEGRYDQAQRELDQAEAAAPPNDLEFRKHLQETRNAVHQKGSPL